VVERPGIAPRDRKEFNSAIDVFRNELKKSDAIESMTASIMIPGKQREYKAEVKRHGAPDQELTTVRFNTMDYDFLNVFGMRLKAGRMFSLEYVSDPDTSVIITESASKSLGFKKPEDAIGQTISIPAFRWSAIVVGVVNDYHQVSLKKSLDPSIFQCSPYGGEFYSLRLKTTQLDKVVDHVKASWNKAFPGNPFDYFFLDDYFNRQYENEKKFGKLFTTFASLALTVGCLGLFGLSAFTATQRTKEIGVRKVLGSTNQGIFTLLSMEYVKLIGLSFLLATPLIWVIMNSWMNGFPYRTTIGADVFFVAGISVLSISLLTVSYQTMRAATNNPVDSLRSE
jgi:putative ABC transport system permease protein